MPFIASRRALVIPRVMALAIAAAWVSNVIAVRTNGSLSQYDYALQASLGIRLTLAGEVGSLVPTQPRRLDWLYEVERRDA